MRFDPLAAIYRCAVLAVSLLLASAPRIRAQGPPPDARWRTIDTNHFHVHYSRGLDSLAARAAVRAEVAWEQLAEATVSPPRGRIDLVVTDNVDYSNGYATPLPTNRIVIFAHPPVDDPALSYFDEWMQLVISHELTHIFHLDYARGPFTAIRRVFGRVPYGFPNLYNPGWVTEGLATYNESRLTRAGRVEGTTHEMEVRTAVLEDRFFTIDRATGNPTSWPGPSGRYVYGSLFVEWLSERYGPEKVNDFMRRTGRTLVPYLLDNAARRTFGVSFTTAWSQWQAELRQRYAPLADSLRRAGLTDAEVLTRAGQYADFPRFSPDGTAIAYAANTGRSQSATRLISAGGDRALAPRNSLDAIAWAPGGRSLVTAQLEARDQYRYFSDLYRVGVDGDVRRITRGARVAEPDVLPDGRRAVAIRSGDGTTELVTVDLASGDVRPLVPATLNEHWAYPRWSPDGLRIAVTRWRPGAYLDIVVLDTAGRVVREVTHDRAVDNNPAWSPDGRYVLFSSDRSGISNLYAYDLQTGELRQVTNVLTGAFEPDVSPDGRWIAFAAYHADGFHIARMPFDPYSWRTASPVRPEYADSVRPDVPRPGSVPAAGAPHRYSPWPSLKPASWSPYVSSESTLGVGIGAATAGNDVMSRHAYAADFLVRPRGGRTDADAVYVYSGLGNPTLSVSAFQDWSVLVGPGVLTSGDTTIQSALLERERSVSATATFARPRYRSYTWLSAGANLRRLHRAWEHPDDPTTQALTLHTVPFDVGGVVTTGYSSVRGYAYSISPENGVLGALTAQARRFTSPFADQPEPTGYLRLTGRGEAFRPLALGGFARHVLALRVAGGGDIGSRSPLLSVGGTGGLGTGLPIGTGFDLGKSLQYPVRGYPEGAQRGDRAVSATAEYRYPIALVERGYRMIPAFLDRLWGTAFADAGTAWCVAECDPTLPTYGRTARPIYSLGAELGADADIFFAGGITLRGGVAFPLSRVDDFDTGARQRPNPQLYLRLGRSF
jgi:Tol biopolymer transport system component